MENPKRIKKEAGNVCPQRRSPTLQVVPVLFLLFFCSNAFAETGTASWYSSKDACKFNPTKGCPTASGISIYDLERTKQDFAATWNYSMGAKLKITNLRNGKTVTVRVVDRGPSKRLNRVIDLSRLSFAKISSLKNGVINVKVEAL